MAGDATQYMIDIAAKMTGGDTAAASLSDLGKRMTDAGSSAQELDTAAKKAAQAFDESGVAAKAAADAVAAGNASYAEAEKQANYAAIAVEKMGQKIAAQQGKLSTALEAGDTASIDAAQAKLDALLAKQEQNQARAASTAAAVADEAAKLDALKSAAAAAVATHDQLGESMKGLKTAATDAADAEKEASEAANGSGKVNEMAEGLGKLGGPIGRIGQKALGAVDGLKKLGSSMGSGAGLAVGLAVAVAAVVIAIVAGIAALGHWAVGLADANRNQALNVEAVSKTSDSLRGLAGILPGVQGATGLATEELTGLAQQLDQAGVKASDMPAALRAVAMAEAALGKGAAAKLVEDLKSGKKSATELAAEMDAKFGGIVAKKMLSLDAQTAKLKTNLAGTFGGLNIEPLLGGFAKLVALFDSNTAAGRALKVIFEALFQPIIDGVSAMIPAIEGAFIQLEIYAMKGWIALKPYQPILSEIGSGLSFIGSIVGTVVVAAFKAVAIPVGMLVVAIGAVIGAVVAVVGLVGGALRSVWGSVVSEAQAAWDAIKEGPTSALMYLLSLPMRFLAAGAEIMSSIAAGIGSVAGAILDSVLAPFRGAVTAVKALLGIHSPSKVFAGIGDNVVAGFSNSVEGGSDVAQSALETMVAPPDAPAAPAGKAKPASAAGTNSTGGSFNFAGASFNFYGVEGAEDAERRIGDVFTRLLEGDVAQVGGGLAPA